MSDWSDGWSGDNRSGLSMWRTEWGNMRALQDQLDSQAAAAASEQRRLSSQLSKVQGDLTQRVDRLARAFDAFVELSQLRDELVLHADARRWRLAAKRLVEGRIAHTIAPAGGGTTPSVDVDGYWLAPAVRALPDAIEGGPHSAELDDAAARDQLRTATFVVACAPLLGALQLVDRWLPVAFAGDGSATLTRAERAIWLAAADGLLQTDDRATVAEALATRLRSAPASSVVAALANRAPANAGRIAPAADTDRSVAAQATAAGTLDRWATWVGRMAADPQPAATEPLDTDDLLLRVVRSLVEEGSAEERPLLDRAEELGRVLDPTAGASTTHWDDPAGDVVELLVGDAADDAHPARARLALALLHDQLLAAGDRLVADASAPPPDVDEVRIGGQTVRVSAGGAEPAALAAATSRLPAERRVQTWHLVAGAVVAVLSIVLAIAASPGWIALAIIAALVVGGLWLADAVAARRDAANAQLGADDARQVVDGRAAALAASQGQAAELAGQAVAARQRLATNLATIVAAQPG